MGGSRGSLLSVKSRLRDGSSRNSSSNPGKGKHFLSSLRYLGWLSGPLGLPFSGYWVYRLGRAADCSPLYNSRIGMSGALLLFWPHMALYRAVRQVRLYLNNTIYFYYYF